MIIKSLLFKKIREHKVIENVSFEEADSGVNSSEISDNLKMSFFWSKYIIFFIIITLEILIAASLSGWLVNKPIFAGLEWLLVLFSAVYFFKINLKSLTKIYLTRYYSSCSIIFMICSFICGVSLWVLLLTFSGERTKEMIGQMMFQSVVSISGFILLSIIIYKYIQYMVIKEIYDYSAETKIPLMGKIIDKFAIYGIIIVFSSMQFYRWNKFWIEGSSSWIAIRLVPIVQIILWIIVLFLLITLPIRLYYPKFLQSYLLQKYSEEFRNKYGFTQKEWYGE